MALFNALETIAVQVTSSLRLCNLQHLFTCVNWLKVIKNSLLYILLYIRVFTEYMKQSERVFLFHIAVGIIVNYHFEEKSKSGEKKINQSSHKLYYKLCN